ncbi:hypothetical protein CBW52_12365 [Yersinia kristensenii]|uniref:Uncharacterized protein n=1 Tax=Yersinia kristensenii TaxID=28152 RepID=A0AB73NMN8_YERKR|nr:hypothetical protein CBW52_12365 [Yersinia kristensenii]PHZ37112.1 hypothetical protein CS536_04315 [Yersinia kristensenii]
MIRVTNRSGTDLNTVCSSLAEARPMGGPSSEHSQRTCSLKYDGVKGAEAPLVLVGTCCTCLAKRRLEHCNQRIILRLSQRLPFRADEL